MTAHPPLTWDDVVAWAQANEVPGTAWLHSDEGQVIDGAEFGGERVLLLATYRKDAVPVTWESVKRQFAASGKPGTCYLGFPDQRTVRDLGVWHEDGEDWEEGDLRPGDYFILQKRWG